MNRRSAIVLAWLLAITTFGCGGATRQEEIEVKPLDPMIQVKSTLMNYVNGKQLGSEVTSYEYMVNEVRKTNPEKADILKAGFDVLEKMKGSPAAKAKELMKKLGIEETK